ncbi:MAG: heavy-metal-associated domain-containing protein [Myxococcales bacterium]|nr:heavy-metal-associated domain-containing protein [Myxococcales bacterium]
MSAQAKFQVSGMSCQGCVRHVQRALGKIEGVGAAEVSVGHVSLEYTPEKVTREVIAAALAEAGYPAIPEA